MDLDTLYVRKPTTLVNAVREGNIEAVKDLLRVGATHPNSADHRGWTALHEAAAVNQLEIVKLLLEDERTNSDANAHDGDLALDVAIDVNASLELVDCLAQNTAQFRQEEYASRLLYEAARSASAEIVKYIITSASVDIQGNKRITPCSPVFVAMARNNDEVVELLLDACDDVNDLYIDGYHKKTIFVAILANCSLKIIKMIINKGATLNFDETALMNAISNDRVDVALELLQHDVDVNHDFCGSTALTLAVLHKQQELVKAILSLISFEKLESLCEEQDFNGLICCALSQYDEEILRVLLNCNFSEPILEAPVSVRFRLSRLILSYKYVGPLTFLLKEKMDSFGNVTLSIMQLLLSKGISIEPRKPSYMPPLVGALLSKSNFDGGPPNCLKPVLRTLLELGVNVDYKTSVLPDALLTAVSQKNLEALLMLLPYSQYTPCDIVRIGIENNMDFLSTFVLENMSTVDDYSELRHCYQGKADVRERCEELLSRFSFKVFPLTVIARHKVRQCLQKRSNSFEYLNMYGKLAIPETLKCYLRFL